MSIHTSKPFPLFAPATLNLTPTPALPYLPTPMVLEDKKPFASTQSAQPLPHIWDALVETAMAEYQREQVPRPPSFSFGQPSLFMAPTPSPFMNMNTMPTPQQPYPNPAMGMGMGFGSAPNAFDSGKGFQFWSH